MYGFLSTHDAPAWSPGRVDSRADKIVISAYLASSFVRNSIYIKQGPCSTFVYPLLGIKFVLPSEHGWGIVPLSPGYSLPSVKSWMFWTGKAISWLHVRYVLVYNGQNVVERLMSRIACSIIHCNAWSSNILDFSHKDYRVYFHCKTNINFALSPPMSDALGNEKRS